MKKNIVNQRVKEFLFYKDNPINFIEDNIYLPLVGGDTKFKLHGPQKIVLNDFYKNHHVILLKSRQTGFSTTFQAICTHIMTFYNNTIIGIVSRNADESSDFCRKVEDMLDKLPIWLRPKYKVKNATSFILTNGCQLHSSAVSPANPESVLRGKSVGLLIIDEAAFIRNIDKAWTGMSMSLSNAQKVAKRRNIPFGTVIISTPNRTRGIGQFYFNYWSSALNNEGIFSPHKIHWSDIDAYKNDSNWYNNQCKILNGDKRKIAQELDLKFIGDEDTLFDEITQEKLQSNNIDPLEIITFNQIHKIYRYDNIDRRKFYLIGADIASDAGSDFSTIEVFTYKDMKQVMEFKGKLPIKKFSEVLKMIAKLCPRNSIIIENNSYGKLVIEELIYDQEYIYNVFSYKEKEEVKYGINTNTKTRPLILEAFFNYVKSDPEMIKSNRLSLELLDLADKKGKIQASSGNNDDLVMAFGFICYVREYMSNHLSFVDDLENEDDIVNNDSVNIVDTFRNLNYDDKKYLETLYKKDEFSNFKKSLNDIIDKKINSDRNGNNYIDVFDLFSKNRNMFGL